MFFAITGMHRSGTSLVTNYLKACGVDIGDDLHPGDRGNPLGYYEDRDFLGFHRQMMKDLRMPLFPNNAGRLKGMPPAARDYARELISSRERNSIWAWKDCRTALFLDDWKEVEPGIRFLFLIRHPSAVVDSLLRRGTNRYIAEKPVKGFRSWMVYNSRILDYYRRYPETCFLIDIGEFLTGPAEAVTSLFHKFGILLSAAEFESVYSRGAFNINATRIDLRFAIRHPLPVLQSIFLYKTMQRSVDWP